MNKQRIGLRTENADLAESMWPGDLGHTSRKALDYLSEKFGLSIALGDLLLLDAKWYVTHMGLLRIAQRRRCHGIRTSLQKDVSDPTASRWVFKATVYKTPGSRGFRRLRRRRSLQTSSLVRGAEMRVAETRAVNRALRKAYGIGSVLSKSSDRSRHRKGPSPSRRIRMATPDRMVQAMASLASATSSAC